MPLLLVVLLLLCGVDVGVGGGGVGDVVAGGCCGVVCVWVGDGVGCDVVAGVVVISSVGVIVV